LYKEKRIFDHRGGDGKENGGKEGGRHSKEIPYRKTTGSETQKKVGDLKIKGEKKTGKKEEKGVLSGGSGEEK